MLLAARANALDALGFTLESGHLAEAARRAGAFADVIRPKVVDASDLAASARRSTKDALACRKGCSWCCHHKVGVTVPEVIAIKAQLEASPQHLDVIKKRAAELAKDARIFSDTEKPRARIPCALLGEDGSCSVYEVRPIPCRSWLSTDVESCKKHLDGEGEPMFVLSAARSGRFVQLGLAKVMADIERFPYLVELTAGLDIALNVPNAIDRWLAGEPVFEPASAARR
jgi:Fe-S-cluster containining protein